MVSTSDNFTELNAFQAGRKLESVVEEVFPSTSWQVSTSFDHNYHWNCGLMEHNDTNFKITLDSNGNLSISNDKRTKVITKLEEVTDTSIKEALIYISQYYLLSPRV